MFLILCKYLNIFRCDRGFGGPYCVPIVPLPSILKDDFNSNLHPDQWPEVYGAERGNLNGETIKSGTALVFKGVSTFCAFCPYQSLDPVCFLLLFYKIVYSFITIYIYYYFS